MVQVKLMANTCLLILGMLKGQLDTRHTLSRFVLRTSKDNIAHRPAAQLLGRGLTQHPAYGINHIGFAAAVWPDDGSDVMTKGKGRWVGKGLKTCQL